MIPGQLWTLKDLFVLPNEYIYWSIQIVMYPFMTGLVAGSFVLSSLYHVFGIKQLKGIASFALVLCFALLPAAMLPLLLHLQNPLRGINVMMTPHFTSAIAAFGVVFSTYFAIVASELWFLYRKHFVEQSLSLKKRPHKTLTEKLFYIIFTAFTLGSFDITRQARQPAGAKALEKLVGLGPNAIDPSSPPFDWKRIFTSSSTVPSTPKHCRNCSRPWRRPITGQCPGSRGRCPRARTIRRPRCWMR